MNLYKKIVNGDKTHIFFLGLPIYYENRKENEIRKRFLWIRSTKKIDSIVDKKGTILGKISRKIMNKNEPCSKYSLYLTKRESIDEVFNMVKNYDIISFDIFDTALLRKVEFPADIFDIMSLEMHWPDFSSARKKAEDYARTQKEKIEGHREIIIDEIYDILHNQYNIDKIWMNREIELEKQSILQNDFIFNLYKKLIDLDKTIIFTSDMYLPKDILIEMLKLGGYHKFKNIYVSNSYKLRKGDGTLQKKLVEIYPHKKIIHIGDNKKADVEQSKKNGIDALWYPDCRLEKREAFLNNISGSIYRAILNNSMNTGMWKHGLHYTHGFRVGGILTAGYCLHINTIAHQMHAEKIFFCARDCYIVQRVYNDFYNQFENHYIDISRYAIMNLSPERYANDILNRFIFRYWNENKNSKTLEQLLQDTGYEYLIPYLEDNDLDRFLYCSNVSKDSFTEFFLSHINILKDFNKNSIQAAKIYFKKMIGESKNILIADIGWSGTCISALEYFIHNNISSSINIIGTLICSSNTKTMCNQILDRYIIPYVSGPCRNNDFNNFMMPSNKKIKEIDIIHMPLEYMYTSSCPSLSAYNIDKNGGFSFIRDTNIPNNIDEIEHMQSGMYDFNKAYIEYTKKLKIDIDISPYVSFIPLKECIADKEYIYNVYKNFLYDACTTPGKKNRNEVKFSSFFPEKCSTRIAISEDKPKILFISPELIYTGAPRSLLRVCRVAKELGYEPIVWSAKDGPFRHEFENDNIYIQIVPAKDIPQKEHLDIISMCECAYCNTIVTDDYVRILEKYIPTIWFIREATNIPSFCRNNPERLNLLQSYNKIFCVSEYAAQAIAQYTNQPIHILHNCVEDERCHAEDYSPGSDEKIKFVQFGTMEYRKGYDILVAAYKAMPQKYQEKCEMYFAGGFINSGTPYCDYLFSEIEDLPAIHYLGIISGMENKIKILSKMDVVVVASRDESCSLVALEGAMLAKPIIVTENVGAKYIIDDSNGIIVKSDDVDSMKNALIKMIDSKNNLNKMGEISRKIYESTAGMPFHKEALKQLFNETKKSGTSKGNITMHADFDETKVIISLTSHPGRISCIHICIDSLMKQTYRNRKIILWLSLNQFPHKEKSIPETLLTLNNIDDFEIRWVEDDLKPHKKYYYACQEFKKYPIIIVDDDVIYDSNMVRKLVDSYKKYPKCISCHRANLMLLRKDRTFRAYNTWPMGYTLLTDTPSYQLLPTGVGGILYPPNALPDYTFDTSIIKKYCLLCDDLWLKMMTVLNGFKTVVVKDYLPYKLIDGSQDVALWRENITRANNDIAIKNICRYIEKNIPNGEICMDRIRKDRFC